MAVSFIGGGNRRTINDTEKAFKATLTMVHENITHTKNSTEMQGEIKCSERFCSSIGTRCATHDKKSAVVILFARQILYC